MEGIDENNVQNDDDYEWLSKEIETEISELNDDNIDNDKFELDGCLTQGFADFVGKEKAQQWLDSINNVFPGNDEELPDGLQELIDFLESIKRSGNDVEYDDPAICDDDNDDVDTTREYGVAMDSSEYDECNSFTSRSGITYKLYDQTQGPRSKYKYQDKKTMSHRGCMLTSAAVVASSLGNFNLTPGDFFNRHRFELVSKSVPAESGKLISKSVTGNDKTINDKIIQGLQDGNPAIIMVKGRKGNGKSRFTSNQHYMALLDISNDGSKVFVGNSHKADGGNYSSNGWYPTSEVLTSVKEATIFPQNEGAQA